MAGTSKKPGDSFPGLKQSPISEATGAEAAALLKPGSVYSAEVVCRQADGSYTVSIADPKIELNGVRMAFPVLGGLLGLQVRCNLPQNTKVQLAYGTPSWIFAVLPENNKDWRCGRDRTLIGGGNMDQSVGVTENMFSDQAEDLLEGEVEFNNLYGVAIEFLTTLLRMRAGDRAAVECHLINDMVRVISGQYRHISGLGEDLIFDHGRPTLERTWSSYRHEVMGMLKEREDFMEMNGDQADMEKLDEERAIAMGRYRFVEFIGFAGDFIHSFVTDPPDTIVKMTKELAGNGAGKSWFHRNADGSVLLQSVADIRLERVCRIPVPVRTDPHEDPSITKARHYDQLVKSMLKLPEMVTPAKPGSMFKAAYHIRSYARWLGRYHSFVRMLQLPNEYRVPTESDSPEPDPNNQERDRQDTNPAADYLDTYACISIMRDGSIVNYDGYGSTIVMSNGNIQIAAVRHLDFEAAGDIRMVAGGSIMMKARRNIELSAALGGVVLHGYAWLKMLSERGSLWLRSNAITDKDTAPKPKGATDANPNGSGGPTPEIAGWKSGEQDGQAIIIETVEGELAIRSGRGMKITGDTAPADDNDHTKDIIIFSKGDVEIGGTRYAKFRGGRGILFGTAGSIAMYGRSLLASVAEMLVGTNLNKPSIVVRGGKLFASMIDSLQLSANTILGSEVGPNVPTPDPMPDVTLKPHYNHIGTLASLLQTPAGADDAQKAAVKAAGDLSSSPPDIPWTSASDGPMWGFGESTEYIWDDREEFVGSMPETLTQQYLRLDQELTAAEKEKLELPASAQDRWGKLGYETWNLRVRLEGMRTNPSAGFVHFTDQLIASNAGDKLSEPSVKPPGEFANPVVSWNLRGGFKIQALKRSPQS